MSSPTPPLAKVSSKSFDGTISHCGEHYRPDRYRDLTSIVQKADVLCPRGSGLSYALSSASNKGPSIDMRLFNRILAFDTATGQITVEAGMPVGKLQEIASEYGWYVSVLPGHPAISVGGCVAFNIHGKSQFKAGNFEAIIDSLAVLHPDHGEIKCSRETNPELFYLTIGGMGLTGIIVTVKIQLQKLEGLSVLRTIFPCENLTESANRMLELERDYPILYSWNNLCRRGERFGSGVIYAEKFLSSSNENIKLDPISYRRPEVSRRSKLSILNGNTAKYINCAYDLKERFGSEMRILPLHLATFPIVGKEFYFNLIGNCGFYEYQVIFPRHTLCDSILALEKLMKKYQIFPSLGSLKQFRGAKRDLCFIDDGVCLAMDLPRSGHPKINQFLSALDELVIGQGGCANIAKDSRISAATVRKMYPHYDFFWRKLFKWDPQRRFDSILRERIEPI